MSDRPEIDATLALLNQLRWLHSKAVLTAAEVEVLKWEVLNGGGDRIRLVLSKIQQLVWLHEQGTLAAEERDQLKLRLLATVGPVFPPAPPPAPSPSSAGAPTTRLAPPAPGWRYLTVEVSLGEGPGALGPEALQDTLDHYGADGWELAAGLPLAGRALLIFKRPDP